MKVTLEDNYREFYTLKEVEQARRLIADMKDDETTAKQAATWAAEAICRTCNDTVKEVFTATATTAGNRRVWNWYGTDSGKFDVWIKGKAETEKGFISFGAYLSDIYSISEDYPMTEHMYIQYAKYPQYQ